MLTGCNPPQSLKEFTVENPLDINREDEALVLTRAQLNPTEKLLKPVITNRQGEYIPCQLDDLDGDGEWDDFFPFRKDPLKSGMDCSGEISGIRPSHECPLWKDDLPRNYRRTVPGCTRQTQSSTRK